MASKLLFTFLALFSNIAYTTSTKENLGRIINGIPASLKEFPYMTFLDNRCEPHVKGTGWYCSGAILTNQWVLTAAHCYRPYFKKGVDISKVITEVRAGTIDRSYKTEHTQDRVSRHHVLHEETPDFALAQTYDNDMAILKVSEPFQLNAFVNTIAIARHPRPYNTKVTCIVVGFGRATYRDNPNVGLKNTKLLHAKAFLDQEKYACRKRAETSGYDTGFLHDWTEKHVCIEMVDHHQSVCIGDSGGPVVCEGLHTGVAVARRNMNRSYYPFICGKMGLYHIYMFTGMYEKWLRKLIPDLRPSKLIVGDTLMQREVPWGGAASLRASSGGLVLLVGGVMCYFLASARDAVAHL